jgi:hypothetical protein
MYVISWMLLRPGKAAALMSDHPYLSAQPKFAAIVIVLRSVEHSDCIRRLDPPNPAHHLCDTIC